MTLPSAPLQELTSPLPWPASPHPLLLGSTLLLRRNIAQYLFPCRLTPPQRKQLLVTLAEALYTLPDLKSSKVIPAQDLTSHDKDFLFEHYLLQTDLQAATVGEAFIVDATKKLFIHLNSQNHLHFHLIEVGEDIEQAIHHLYSLAQKVHRSLPLAFSPQFGFLTSDATLCGIGLTGHTHLLLPLTLASPCWQDTLHSLDPSITLTDLQGHPPTASSTLVVIKNRYTLGLSEDKVLSALKRTTFSLINTEHALRQQLLAQEGPEQDLWKDRIARALGLLTLSYRLELMEALDALSLCLLGLDIGWVQGMALSQMKALLFEVRRGHLYFQHRGPLSPQERPILRAKVLKESLKSAFLIF